MRMNGQHFSNTDLINKFLYNGKELQDQTNYYDYGFRQMDPQLGRWHVVDALAESYMSHSPYAYTMNDPVNHIDVAGLYSDRRGNGRVLYQHPDGRGGRDDDDFMWMDNGIGRLWGLGNAHHNNPYRNIGGSFEDYWTGVNGEWVHNSYLYGQGAYFWDEDNNDLHLYSKDLDKWAVIDLDDNDPDGGDDDKEEEYTGGPLVGVSGDFCATMLAGFSLEYGQIYSLDGKIAKEFISTGFVIGYETSVGYNIFLIYPKDGFKLSDFEGVGRNIGLSIGPLSGEFEANNISQSYYIDEMSTYYIIKFGYGMGTPGGHIGIYETTRFVKAASNIDWSNISQYSKLWK